MASIGQADHHMSGISRLQTPMSPAAFSNAWASDYHHGSSSYHHVRPTFNRNGSTNTSSGGYHHSAPGPVESSPSVWQQRQASGSDIVMPHHHHHNSHSEDSNMRGGSSRVTAMLGSPKSMNRGSPVSLQNSSSELFDSNGTNTTTTTVGGDWQQFVDSSVRYSSLLPQVSSCGSPLQQHSGSSTGGGGSNEGVMIRELIGRLGGGCSGGPLTSTSPAPLPSQRVGGVIVGEKLAVSKRGDGNHTSWNVNSANAVATVEMAGNVSSGLTLDPSKGGLSLNGHCISRSPFSGHGDPSFAERAARFSSFSNGNYAAQPFSLTTTTECGGAASRMLPRSSGAAAPHSESSTKPQRESAGVLNNAQPDLRLDSVGRESHSVRGVSDDFLASAAHDHDDDDDDDDEDDNSAEGNYGLVKGTPVVKLLSRTASNLLVSTRRVHEQNGEEEEEEEEEAGGGTTTTTTTTSADAAFNPACKIRGISTSSPVSQTGAAAGPREACPSPAGSSGATDISAKKRKTSILEERRTSNTDVGSASSHGERDAQAAEAEDSKTKRFRRGDGGSKDKEEMRSKAERSCSETLGETSPRPMKANSKPSSEPPSKTDYIHVRARRGQATDSHSLAERVRREKISERMKFLQDLVPGCSKVTGKAVMLDEIINYVQSLQRQVEFQSMKLASVNPRLDFNLESFLGKEGGPQPISQAIVFGSENGNLYPPMHPHLLQHQGQLQQGLSDYLLHSEATSRRSLGVPVPPAVNPRVDGFVDGVICQTGWDDGELQSIVQMGIGHSPSISSRSPALHCHLPPGHVKVESNLLFGEDL